MKVEAGCRNDSCSLDERYERRQTYTLPILESLKEWMDQQALVVTPGCPTGKAIAYCNRRWANLIKYANTGNVEIDNNLVEMQSDHLLWVAKTISLLVGTKQP